MWKGLFFSRALSGVREGEKKRVKDKERKRERRKQVPASSQRVSLCHSIMHVSRVRISKKKKQEREGEERVMTDPHAPAQ